MKLRAIICANGISFDRAYCSTQERASDTLEIIAGPEMEYDRLKELKEKTTAFMRVEVFCSGRYLGVLLAAARSKMTVK